MIKIFNCEKIEVVMDALKQLNSVLEDGERPVIIGFGTDIVEYIAMGIHQLYPEWIGNVDIAGICNGWNEGKNLEWTVRLLLRNPETVAICAAELLSQKIMGEKEEKEPRKYDVKVKYEF